MSTTALVYRPDNTAITFNPFGDPVDSSGQVIRPESPQDYLGKLEVVISNLMSEPIEPRLTGSGGGSVDRAEAADITAQIGAPRDGGPNNILLQHGDRLVIADSSGRALYWQIVGPRNFDWANSLTGWGHRLYWVTALSTDG